MKDRDSCPASWLARVLGAVAPVVLVVSACGLPGDTEVRAVDDDDVPYRLLEPASSPGPSAVEQAVPRRTPVVFWLTGDNRLAPAPALVSCADGPGVVVRRVLELLESPPEEGARPEGSSSALPPGSRLELLALEDGTAQVSFDPAASISAERLPPAVGQVVLSVTSAPRVERVRLSIAGDTVQVPLPGGALTSRAVTADDYAALVPPRLSEGGTGSAVAADIGCP